MDKTKLNEMNRRFDARLNELMSVKGQNTQFFTSKSYTETIEKVKCSKAKIKNKKPEDYQRLRRFDVMTVGETEKLIVPVKEDNMIRFYVINDEIFQILHDAHLAVGHGGRNRMEKELNWRFKNITREMIATYLNLCEDCDKKRNIPKKVSVVKPVPNNEIYTRCQVDLIDMQSQEDNQYKFILIYRDYLTKFVQLRPLKTETAKEIANVLLDIFTIFGAPSILHSNNRREFTNEIVREACNMWPELKLVYGKTKYESKGPVERANQDIENMLSTWLEDNKTNKWTEGLRFVQLKLNKIHHSSINSTPYEAMFGNKLKMGLKSSLPHDPLLDGNSEVLEKVLFSENTQNDKMEIDHIEYNDNYAQLFSPIVTLDVQDETLHSNNEILANETVSSEHNVKVKEENAEILIQANKMWNASTKYPKPKIGDTVRVRVQDNNKTPDGRKIIATVVEITPSNLYKLGTKQGVLNELYPRNQFTVCRKRFVSPSDTEISHSESVKIKREVVESNLVLNHLA